MNLGRAGILLIAELALVAVLLLIASALFSGWVSSAEPDAAFWPGGLAARVPEFSSGELMLGVAVITGLYGLLLAVGRPRLGFMIVASLALASHIPVIWQHNRLDWERFLGPETPSDPAQQLLATAAFFLVSLVGMFLVHRIMALRRMERELTVRRIYPSEIGGILARESVAQVALVGLGVLVAVVLLLLGAALGGQQWLAERTPWAVISIGAAATLLLMGFIALFLRGLTTSDSSGSPKT